MRYYPQYERIFNRMRELALTQWRLSDEQRARLDAVTDCVALRTLRGVDDYVVSPCNGTVGGVLEGTRLTLQDRPPEGVELSIRTPLTPDRWAQYATEMQGVWAHLCKIGADHFRAGGGVGSDGGAQASVEAGGSVGVEHRGLADTLAPSEHQLVDAALRLTFYWFNFMPLTRGTAATGWAMLMALLLAFGIEVADSPPTGMCVDWEAILTPDPTDFADAVRPWLLASCRRPMQPVQNLPSVSSTFGTVQDMLEALIMGA